MSPRQDYSNEDKDQIQQNLEIAYKNGLADFYAQSQSLGNSVDVNFRTWLDIVSKKSEQASAAFNNIVTGLAIKCAFPELDVRYHQTQIQPQSRLRQPWFNHRGVSEKVVYPWLNSKNFNGAKSGWQTRTLERPKPYMLDYDENIGSVKMEFLSIYDFIENNPLAQVKAGLAYLILCQIEFRESKRIDLATPNIDAIATIVNHLTRHINYEYSGKGASRLPVLCLYATLELVQDEVARYADLRLKPLESHSAADSQTGSAGDIEFETSSHQVSEAIEVKHLIPVTHRLILDIQTKISPFQLDRYFVLTTHLNCTPSSDTLNLLNNIKSKIGCQIIVNGVIPTIQYYLRLLKEPQKVYVNYTRLLKEDSAVTHEHREIWNQIILG